LQRGERPTRAPDGAQCPELNDWLLNKYLSVRLEVVFKSIRQIERLEEAVKWSLENNADDIDDIADSREELASHLNLKGTKHTGLVRALEPYARFPVVPAAK
jgi:hypothetical protein